MEVKNSIILSCLPQDLQEKIKNNLNTSTFLSETSPNFRDFIDYGMTWWSTPEGEYYWEHFSELSLYDWIFEDGEKMQNHLKTLAYKEGEAKFENILKY